jgi:hypothetical protein
VPYVGGTAGAGSGGSSFAGNNLENDKSLEPNLRVTRWQDDVIAKENVRKKNA